MALPPDLAEAHPSVHGVLSVTVLAARIPQLDIDVSVYVQISVGSIIKVSQVAQHSVSSSGRRQLGFNHTSFLPMRLHRNRLNPSNLLALKINMMRSFDENHGREAHDVAATIVFHVHDVVRAAPTTGTFELVQGARTVGEIDLEFYWCYGDFGYGYSCQLGSESEETEERLVNSMLPRVEPPQQRCETQRVTLTPRRIPHPKFIAPADRVHFGDGTLGAPGDGMTEESQRYPLLYSKMGRLHSLHARLSSSSNLNRQDRLAFLQRQIIASSTARTTQRMRDDKSLNEYDHTHKAYTKFLKPTRQLLAERTAQRGALDGRPPDSHP